MWIHERIISGVAGIINLILCNLHILFGNYMSYHDKNIRAVAKEDVAHNDNSHSNIIYSMVPAR